MSEQQETGPDLVARLLRAAGRREEPPADAYRQTVQAVTDTWQRKVRARRRQRVIAWAAAACVIAAVAAGLLVERVRPDAASIVARVERVVGTAEMHRAPHGRWASLDARSPGLRAGAMVRTDESGLVGFVLPGGASLRVAPRTEIALTSATRIRLLTGRVYIDNGQVAGHAERIEVETPAGVAWDVGTQFEVRYVDAMYRLRVRQGSVFLRRGEQAIASSAGDEVSIDAAGIVTRERIARDAEEWRWVQALSPAPDLEGQPVSALLAWVARETGRAVRFEPPEVERKARRTILHGDVRSLAPLEALEVMLETTDLAFVLLEDGTIVIRSRAAS